MKIPLRAAVLVCALVLTLSTGSSLNGQQQPPRMVAVAASAGSLEPWVSRVDEMLRDGRLDIASIQTDTMLAGRTHQRLDQIPELYRRKSELEPPDRRRETLRAALDLAREQKSRALEQRIAAALAPS